MCRSGLTQFGLTLNANGLDFQVPKPVQSGVLPVQSPEVIEEIVHAKDEEDIDLQTFNALPADVSSDRSLGGDRCNNALEWSENVSDHRV